MALAPADFYAYSRATGAPIPEDPEERAAMAPEVLAFRRNQLRAPEPESNPLATVGAVAAGLGALAGGAYAARRLLGKPQAKPVVPPSKLATTTQNLTPEGLANISSVSRQQAAEQTERQLRQERPQGVVQTDLSYVDEILNDPGLRSQVEYEEFTQNLTPKGLSELRGAESRARNEYRGLITEIGDQAIAQERAQIQSQTIGALESGEDQVTGRIMRGVQRNENLDASQVNELAVQTGNAVAATAATPDGIPVDQTTTATRALSSQELADIAKSEMMALRQDLEARGLRPGTQRFERALAQTWTTKSMPGVEPGTQEFRRLQELGKVDVSLPASIRKAVDVVGVGADPTGFVPERTVLNIGPQAQVTQTAAGTAIRGAAPFYHEALPKLEERQLTGTGDPLVYGVPDEMGPDIAGAARVAGAMPTDIPESALSKQEITYSFLNKPPAPELPGGAAGIGIYGVEPAYVPGAMSKRSGEYSAAAERRPTDVPGWLQRKEMRSGFESLSTPQLASAAEKATGRVQQAFQGELQRRQTAKESIAASEVLRRARIEGRDPQMILRQLGFGR